MDLIKPADENEQILERFKTTCMEQLRMPLATIEALIQMKRKKQETLRAALMRINRLTINTMSPFDSICVELSIESPIKKYLESDRFYLCIIKLITALDILIDIPN